MTARDLARAFRSAAAVQDAATAEDAVNRLTAVNGIGEVRKVTMVLDWGPDSERKRSQKELEREVRERLEQLPGVRQRFLSSEPGEQLMLVLSGDDPVRLYRAAGEFERDLRSIQGLGTISSTASLLRPELVIVPDATHLFEEAGTLDQVVTHAIRWFIGHF